MSESVNTAQTDIYDEEFFNNLQLAKKLLEKISNRRDRQICRKWITKLCNFKSEDALVKKNRNIFFKYMLRMLHKAADRESEIPREEKPVGDESQFASKWSPDNRTYIATKPLPGEGVLIYMAVSADPKLGWDHA